MLRTSARLSFAALIAILLLAAVPMLAQDDVLDETPRIAIISAFTPELEALLANVEDAESYMINGVEFTTGTLAGNDVVLFLSGVSMTNAAMNTQLLLDHFNVTHIVYSGIAGGVNPALNIGDVTVPAQWGQYQEMLFARESGEGEFTPPVWITATYPNFGMMFPQNTNVRTDAHPEGEDKFWFEADGAMLEVAETVAESVELQDCTPDNVCLENAPRVIVGGNGVSGSTFVDNAEFREWAFDTFEANVLDMETASTAMVAYANGVPFIAFRSLSDLAGGGPGENEIGTFFQVAANNSAMVVMAFLEAWAAEAE
jgi:adenosylhomocysteine nucleosidase